MYCKRWFWVKMFALMYVDYEFINNFFFLGQMKHF